MPLPNGLGWEGSFVIWLLITAVGGLVAVTIFFLIRYIQKNDEHHNNMESAIKAQSSKMETHICSMREVATKMDNTAVSLERSNARFQQQVNSELLAINKTSTKIHIDLADCTRQISDIKTKTDDIVKTVDAHHKSLSLGAQAMHKQREKIGEIETTVRDIKNNLVIVGQKKK